MEWLSWLTLAIALVSIALNVWCFLDRRRGKPLPLTPEEQEREWLAELVRLGDLSLEEARERFEAWWQAWTEAQRPTG